jgi:glutathione S-transferase
MTLLQLHTYQTPNGHKASIMLEETGLLYEVRVVDIERGDQHAAAFLALNPNGKIPVVIDPDRGRAVFESGAILFYLAERSGRLLPADEEARTRTLQWVLFQAAHVGPTLGQLWNFKIFAPEKIPHVIGRFERETDRVLRVLDGRLGGEPLSRGRCRRRRRRDDLALDPRGHVETRRRPRSLHEPLPLARRDRLAAGGSARPPRPRSQRA